jgi:hypothetical protein
MTNLHNDHKDNLVSFLRHNQPIPPVPSPNLEQRLIDSLEPQAKKSLGFKTTKIGSRLPDQIKLSMPVKLIATGFLFTSVSFGIKTPQTVLEPNDLDNFFVKNWQNTLDSKSYTAMEEPEAYWLLPTISESEPALSVSAQ